jgi:glucose-6-phosphate isomerase
MIIIGTSKSKVAKKCPIFKGETPVFANYKPDLKTIKKVASKYKNVKNIILIGNGGSITSFYYYVKALGTNKNYYIVSTMEPDFLASVKSRCKASETVIIIVSKSGNTVGVIESFMYFKGYKNIVVITENKESAIKSIQERMGYDYIEHPIVGGRYSGFTPSGLLPAAIAGLNIDKIWKGASKSYLRYSMKKQGNDAMKLANIFFELDKKGYSEIFMPIYSSKLEGSINILMQLLHESCGKEGKGQTLLATFAPESQHHTNQRFFGGKKNMIGCFVVDEQDDDTSVVKIPSELQSIKLREGSLLDLVGNSYQKSLSAEFIGTKEDAILNKIPNVVINIGNITEESIAEYLAFWHYVTVYVCMLNNVNPFDQPQVENSKLISYKLRKE